MNGQSKEFRNMKICVLHEAGMTYRDIGKAYGICGVRVGQIVKKAEKQKLLESDELYSKLAEQSCGRKNVLTRAFNLLRKHGYTTLESIELLDRETVLSWMNAGVNVADLIEKAKRA